MSRDLSFCDEPSSDQSHVLDDEALKVAIEKGHSQTGGEISRFRMKQTSPESHRESLQVEQVGTQHTVGAQQATTSDTLKRTRH